jgi:hypothetical protein
MQMTSHAVTKTVLVETSQPKAFEVFTAGFDSWWPRTHHTGEGDLIEAVIEPHEGGRWYAKTSIGEEEWGKVLVWDPPARIVLDWQLDADFRYDADFHTEVEAVFIPESDTRTRLHFEHRDLQRYGERAAELAAALSSAGGWTGILSGYAAEAGRAKTE